MRPITENEAIALKNEVLALKEEAKNNEHMRSQLSASAIEWINSEINELEEHQLFPIIQELYDTKENKYWEEENTEKIYRIAKFLKATRDMIYWSVGGKLESIASHHYSMYKSEKVRITTLVICHGTDVKKNVRKTRKQHNPYKRSKSNKTHL